MSHRDDQRRRRCKAMTKKRTPHDAHRELKQQIMLAFGRIAPLEFRVWLQETGVGRALTGGQIISFGRKGAADVSGIAYLAPGIGIRLEVEAKTGRGTQSKEQRDFEAMATRFGAIYIVCSAPTEADEKPAAADAVAEARRRVRALRVKYGLDTQPTVAEYPAPGPVVGQEDSRE
jgi:hypothetical protein